MKLKSLWPVGCSDFGGFLFRWKTCSDRGDVNTGFDFLTGNVIHAGNVACWMGDNPPFCNHSCRGSYSLHLYFQCIRASESSLTRWHGRHCLHMLSIESQHFVSRFFLGQWPAVAGLTCDSTAAKQERLSQHQEFDYCFHIIAEQC